MDRKIKAAPWIVVGLLLAATGASAQDSRPAAAPAAPAGRAELQTLVARLDSIAAAPSTAADERARARLEAERIRRRLEAGDFHAGDAIELIVEGEAALSDTFEVAPGKRLALPIVGTLPLDGVLRSELESHLRDHLGRFIREPRVRVRPLVRISIVGEVAAPGYYLVTPHAPLSEALMSAGGFTRDAQVEKLRVEREGSPLWKGEGLQRALAEGRTLDDMDLRAGDRILVPRRGGGFASGAGRVLLIVLPPLVYGATRLF